MLKIMPETKNNVLIVRVSQKMTMDDYEMLLIPVISKIIEKYKKIRILFYLDSHFEGWEVAAMWEDARLGMQHRHDFEKIAIVGASKWIEWGSKMGAYFMDGQITNFPAEQLKEALVWIKN